MNCGLSLPKSSTVMDDDKILASPGTPFDTPISGFRQRVFGGIDYDIPEEVEVPTTSQPDRLIPERGTKESVGVSMYQLKKGGTSLACERGPGQEDSSVGEYYRMNLACSLFGASPDEVSDRILPIGSKNKHQGILSEHDSNLRVIYSRNRRRNFRNNTFRYIPQTPERILDAPDLIDDYYLNLLDWSSTNILTVALSQICYLWNAESGDITHLTQTSDENIITSVKFAQEGNTLAIGSNSADIDLWDTTTGEKTKGLKGHFARVGSLAWNGKLLASGSRSNLILLHDTRVGSQPIDTLSAHQQEVCGLQWSPDGSQLASGGNDNMLHVWDNRNRTNPRLRLSSHRAAVKALGWSPHQSGLLASGGGTADRSIRFWNTLTGECINTIDTKSQVCSMLWSKNRNELLTSHGYSENQLSLWKYPSMKRIANLSGHSSRVLHLALSPDAQTVVSAAGDETIRFWKCFAEEKTAKRQKIVAEPSHFAPLTLR